MGGRKGKGQQGQNAPRAKKLARASPRAVPKVYCMRREGGNAAGRREEKERGGWSETEMRLRLKKGITSGRDPGEKEQNLVCNGHIFADLPRITNRLQLSDKRFYDEKNIFL